MRKLIFFAVGLLCAICVPAASADTLTTTLSGSAEQGMPLDVTFSGSAAAIDDSGDGPFLYAVARPVDGVSCQSTFGADQDAAGDDSEVIEDGTELDTGSPYSLEDEIDPDPDGAYIICAWVETDGDDGDDTVSASEVTAGPITTSFTVAGPQVSPIKLTLPSHVAANQQYTLRYATQTDQDLTLDSVVIPAGTGGCSDSYEDQLSADPNADDPLDGGSDINGKQTTTATDTESAGSYVICSWIEGPDDSQVDASLATKLTVGSTASGAAASSSGTGSTTSSAACTVPVSAGATVKTVKRRLLAAGCSVGAVHELTSTKVKAGRVIRLADAPGTQLKHDARVAIFLSRG